MSYDDWKLATPWDDEVSRTIDFECKYCEEYYEDLEVIVGRNSYGVDVECEKCKQNNYVGFGE